MDTVIACTPPFAAAYGTRKIERTATDPMLTMAPAPRARMCGITAWQPHRVGHRDREISFSISSSRYSQNGFDQMVPPTLWTATSMAPSLSMHCATTLRAAAACSRSAMRGKASPPAARMPSVTACACCAWASAMATRAPSRASRSATARPMPWAAPVTSAPLPAKRSLLGDAGIFCFLRPDGQLGDDETGKLVRRAGVVGHSHLRELGLKSRGLEHLVRGAIQRLDDVLRRSGRR